MPPSGGSENAFSLVNATSRSTIVAPARIPGSLFTREGLPMTKTNEARRDLPPGLSSSPLKKENEEKSSVRRFRRGGIPGSQQVLEQLGVALQLLVENSRQMTDALIGGGVTTELLLVGLEVGRHGLKGLLVGAQHLFEPFQPLRHLFDLNGVAVESGVDAILHATQAEDDGREKSQAENDQKSHEEDALHGPPRPRSFASAQAYFLSDGLKLIPHFSSSSHSETMTKPWK